MRGDTPPRPDCSDDDELGILVDNGEGDFDDEALNDDDDDELEEIELEDLEHHLSTLREVDENQDNGSDDDGIGMHRATPEDKAILTFSEHTNAVFSCHIHPEHDIAVTGGQDDVAYIWDLYDGHILEKITEHTDTVTTTKFSHDGNYLLTGDMAGCICVFRIQMDGSALNSEIPSGSSKVGKSQLSLNKVWANTIGDMAWCFWHDRTNVIFAGSAETGEIYMYRIPSGDCKVFVGPGNCCAAGELTEDGKKLFASYNDGSLRLWDLRGGNTILCVNNQHSNDMVPSLACDKNGSLYASGDWNGKILFSTQNGPIQSVQTNGVVECLAFSPSPDLKLLASATQEGETTIWDCTLYAKRVTCAQPDDAQACICSMKWLNANSLAIGTADGDILIYDARSGSLKHKLTGHRVYVYEFYYSRRTNMLISVSEDCKAKVFLVPELDD